MGNVRAHPSDSNHGQTDPHYRDLADQYPATIVTGTDLSPIQPSWVPGNCRFEIDDAASDWTYTNESFDFIHVRGLYGCIRDWPAFYEEVYR